MLASRTKPALLQLEVAEADDDSGNVTSIKAHLWRAEMLTGVVEIDKEGVIQKAGCCALHMPGTLFGVASASLLHTPLTKWLNVPASHDALLIDPNKKGALKKNVADVKIGPLRHCLGPHADGEPVSVAVQAVVKEGTGPDRLVVKLNVEKPHKGSSDFAARMLGLTGSASKMLAMAAEGDAGAVDDGAARAGRQKGGVKFGGADASSDEGAGGGEGGRTAAAAALRIGAASHKSERLMDWMRQSSHLTGDPDSPAPGGGGFDLPPPPDEGVNGYAVPPDANAAGEENGSQVSGGDDALSQQSGGDGGGGYHSDFKRGKRLRKLARMLSSKQATKASSRFYSHTVMVILALLAAHVACFVSSVVLLDSQKQYIQEVDDAGRAVIAFHRMAIDCRVLDALHRGVEQEGIFTQPELGKFLDLFKDAIDQFHHQHENTYLGRSKLRRFVNRKKYSLQDYWESPVWNVSELIDTSPPQSSMRKSGLWELGNEIVAAAREVHSNHERMAAGGKRVSESRFWHFVMENSPWSLYSGYKLTLYGLVERVLAKIQEVGTAMVILLVLEGCAVCLAATAYVHLLMKKMVSQRCNLFSVFLVIPTGFLRALAAKQVQLDEDGDSDDESEAGDGEQAEAGGGAQQAAAAPGAKLNLSLPGKKGGGKGGPADGGSLLGGRGRPRGVMGLLARALNPLSWFGSTKGGLETGKKQLVRNSRDALLLMAPFLMWTAVMVMIYAVSYLQLQRVKAPFQMLNMINFLVFRVTRGVLFGLETCMAPDSAMKDLRKLQTAGRLHDLKHDYTAFLYGYDALGPGGDRDDLTTDQAAVFQNARLATIFFKYEGCLREDRSACFPPGHKFHDVTMHGLDAMATRFMQETELLLADANGDINISSSRLEYLWQVGRHDLFEGMTEADTVFRESVEGMFESLRTAHILVFVASLVAALCLWLALVRPYLRRSGKETRQIAEMLSQLPPEMDVEGLVAQALASGGDAAGLPADEPAAAGGGLGPTAAKRGSAAGAGGGKGGGGGGGEWAGGGGGRRGGGDSIPAGREGGGGNYMGSEASDY